MPLYNFKTNFISENKPLEKIFNITWEIISVNIT